MFRIGNRAGRLSIQDRVRRQHRHLRSPQRACKRLDSPIEFVIANNPRVVFEMIKQIDHQLALVTQADVGALIHVPDIDQDRVRIFPLPKPDLRDATRHSAAIRISVVIGGRQDMAVEVRCVQDRHGDSVGI